MFQTLRSAIQRHLPATRADRVPPRARGRSTHAGEAGCWWHHEAVAMGTTITLDLWAKNQALASEAWAAVMQVMTHVDATMSPHKASSELSLINREAPHRAVVISQELFKLLQQARAFSAMSDGAFDITFASVGRHYDFREGVAPDAATLAASLPGVGWRHVRLDERQHTVQFSHPATCIDLGGFAKGHAVDCAAARLREGGVAHAYLSAGGDSCVIGDRRGRPWSLGVRDPRSDDDLLAVLPLQDVSVSTSGDYERCFMRDGERFHHLIDPRTGRSARGARSVTVLAPDGLTAEALSKTVFVLGPEAGLKLARRLPDVDVVAMDAAGCLHTTSGLLELRPSGLAQ